MSSRKKWSAKKFSHSETFIKQPLVDQYFCLSALFALKWLYWYRRKKLPDNSLLEYWLDDCNYGDYKNIWTQTNSQINKSQICWQLLLRHQQYSRENIESR